jgi:hypothetical protein
MTTQGALRGAVVMTGERQFVAERIVCVLGD